MEEILQKLKSRKLWLSLGGMCAGIALAFGVDASDLQTVAGAVTTMVSVVVYVLTEGQVDAIAVETTARKLCDAAEAVAGQKHG